MSALLLRNIGELITMAPLAKQKCFISGSIADLGVLSNAWLFCLDGKVQAFGKEPCNKEFLDVPNLTSVDVKKKLVLPGLIDSHTHPLFAGTRHDEFARRLDGATYQEIAKHGGGIASTVKATRNASDPELLSSLQARLGKFLSLGVTTVEVKSGYALDPTEELRHLKILKQAKDQGPQHLEITCLGLHSRSLNGLKNADYIAQMLEILPTIKKENLANWVDVFIEEGYFSGEECNAYMQNARSLGLGIRVHADEFTNSKGATFAAQWQAKSADHLQHADAASLKRMAEQEVVATILPGTSLYTNIPFCEAPRFFAAGCIVAIATDFNPGSCLLANLPQLTSIAAVQCKLQLHQALTAVTLAPAFSLGIENKKGSLAEGYDADFIIHNLTCKEEWLADFGQTKPEQVWIGQKRAVLNSEP